MGPCPVWHWETYLSDDPESNALCEEHSSQYREYPTVDIPCIGIPDSGYP
jgi:hypothetical protein